ncbi:MAG: site-specific integrase [Lachnospiraceae bacterium]
MASAKKLPSGQWRTLVYDFTDENGRRHYESFTAATKKESEFQAAEYALKKKSRNKAAVKFSDAMDNFIKAKDNVFSESTMTSYRYMKKLLEEGYPDFCSLDIYKITQEQIQVLVNDQAAKFSSKTVRNRYGFISSVIKMYRPDDYFHVSLPQKVRPDLYLPTDDDVKRLLSAVKDTELEIPVMLAAFATMREGEICALTIDDLDGNVIHVSKSKVRTYDGEFIDKAPKTYSSDRYIELPQFLADKIREKGYITNYKPNSIMDALDRTLTRNNIPRFRFHDLRHYSASVMHALGIPDVYIMQRGGWNTDTVLKSVYRHSMSDRQKEMNEIANQHFAKVCNTKCNTKNKKVSK